MRAVAIIAAIAGVAGAAAAGEVAELVVVDGDRLEIDGRAVELWGIDAPEYGQLCRFGATESDCGVLARAALLDLTAGARVVCEPAGEAGGGTVTCFADGYDLAEGMAYTGWALADVAQTARYLSWQRDAEAHRRGLWRFEFVPPQAWRAGARLEPADAER